MKLQFGRVNNPGPVRDPKNSTTVIEQGVMQPDAAKRILSAERQELKAKLTTILDRGVVQDRLWVDLPDDIHGEWVLNNPLEINRLKLLGFDVDTEYAPKRAIHGDGSNAGIVGDVIFMTCPKVVKEIIDEIRDEQARATYAPRKVGKADLGREDRDFLNSVEQHPGSGVTAFSESTEHAATYDDVKSALKGIDQQVKPFHQR